MNQGFITSTAYAAGDSGMINVEVGNSLAMNVGAISSNAKEGDAGSVTVNAHTMELAWGSITSDSHSGDGGDVTVAAAGNLGLFQSAITTNAGADFNSADIGKGGNVTVTAGNMVMDGSQVASRAIGQGDGGTISIEVDHYLGLFGQSKIYTDTMGAGLAGLVSVSATDMQLDHSLITSNSDGSGDAGGVSVTADHASLSNESKISSDAFGSGDGGVTLLDIAGTLTLESGSFVSSDSFDIGNAGGVVIEAGEVHVRGPSFISSDAYGDGDGGAVFVEASKLVEVADGGRISSNVFGAGDGGDVLVSAPTINLLRDGTISSDAQFEIFRQRRQCRSRRRHHQAFKRELDHVRRGRRGRRRRGHGKCRRSVARRRILPLVDHLRRR